jgi:bacillopeptidase F (M6 metalloprotease family)
MIPGSVTQSFLQSQDWQCGAPTSGPGAAYGGSNCLATRLDDNYNNNQAWSTTTATSPEIDLGSASTPQLSFWAWVYTEGSVYDGFNLKISTDGGTSFSLLSAVSPAYNLTVNGEQAWGGYLSTLGWQEFTADLSGYVGQFVSLQLAFRSDGSIVYPGVYLDDFVIGD